MARDRLTYPCPLAFLAACVLLTACAHGVSATPRVTAQFAAGQTANTAALTITLRQITDPYRPAGLATQPAAGNRYLAVEVRVLERDNTRRTGFSFALATTDGQLYAPAIVSTSGNNLDLLAFRPDEPAEGAIVFEIPATAQVAGLRYVSPPTETLLSWAAAPLQ